MKKNLKFFGQILKRGLFVVFAAALVASCSDYDDDDFKRMQGEIDANTSAIGALQQLVASGKYIQGVKANASGTGIVVTDSDGTTYEIKSGANGKDGSDGKDGASAVVTIKDGYWFINDIATGVKAIGVDGKNGADGKDGANGKDGSDGKDGVSPVVSIIDGYWAINGVKTSQTAVPANGGMIVVDATKSGYYALNITSADGTKTSVNLPKASTLVTSLSFVPKYYLEEGDASNAVIAFPYIKALNSKIYRGKANISYAVNPTSVPLACFTLEGFSKKSAILLKSSSIEKDNSISIIENSASVTSGILSFKLKANLAVTAEKKDYVALIVKNKEAADEQYVYSEYIAAVNKEFKNVELVRESQPTKKRIPLISNSNDYPAAVENFQILYTDQTGFDLVDSLAAYFQGLPSPDYLKDNGFDDYTYEFTGVSYSNEGVDQTKYLDKTDATFKTKGRIKVTKDPDNLTGNRYHFAAIGRTPIVKVDLKSPEGDILISKFIKIKIVQTVTPIVLNDIPFGGPVSYERACTSKDVELDLDKLFNNVGVQMGKVEFFNTYSYAETKTTTGFAKGLTLVSVKDQNRLLLTIPHTIAAGTYKVEGVYTATGRATIKISYDVTITNPAVKPLVKNMIWWTGDGNNTIEITGRANSTNNEWLEEGQLSNAFIDPKAILVNASSCPIVDLRYQLVTDKGVVTTYKGVTLNSITGKIELADNADGEAYVNTDYNNLVKPIYVRVVAIYDGNVDVYEVIQQPFKVYFKSPVLALTNIGVTDKLKDKYDNTVDGFKFFKLLDFKNQVIYENGAFNLGLQDLYDVTLKSLTVNGYTDMSGNKVNLVANQQKVDISDPRKIKWINTGENLQKAIIAVIDVKFEHKWGIREGQIKIQIDPL